MEKFQEYPKCSLVANNEQEPQLESKIEIVKDETGQTANVFVIKSEKKFDLTDYLPKDTKFFANYSSSAKYRYWDRHTVSIGQAPIVEFPSVEVNSRSGRLGILHEMGEAIGYERKYFPESWRHTLSEIDSIVRAIVKKEPNYKRFKIEKNRRAYLVKKLHEYMNERVYLSAKYAIKNLIQKEEKAWEIALKLHQKIIEEKGIDLLEGMTKDEISLAINNDLLNYRTKYQNLFPEISFDW